MSQPAGADGWSGGWASLPAMAVATAGRLADHTAVVDAHRRLTYGELLDEARTFGAALVASGVGRGDRVAIWAPNSADWVVAVLGLWHAVAVLRGGLVATPAAPAPARARGGDAPGSKVADRLGRAAARRGQRHVDGPVD